MLKNKKILTVLAVAIVLVLVGGGLYLNSKNNDTDTGSGNDGINYSPPTEEQKNAAMDSREDSSTSENNSGQTTTIKSVQPIITSYGQTGSKVAVSARVPGVIEESGNCLLTMSKGSLKVTQSKQAVPNVSEMSCGFISIPRSKLSAGSWSATISYNSAKAKGVSDPKTIEVK